MVIAKFVIVKLFKTIHQQVIPSVDFKVDHLWCYYGIQSTTDILVIYPKRISLRPLQVHTHLVVTLIKQTGSHILKTRPPIHLDPACTLYIIQVCSVVILELQQECDFGSWLELECVIC